MQTPQPLSKSDAFARLPAPWPVDPLPEIRAAIARTGHKVVVLDDDPTGTQTVYDTPVLTTWETEALAAELRDPRPACFILTNTRSVTADRAVAMNMEIAHALTQASAQVGRKFTLLSRSDSTLRGHFPDEIDALRAALAVEFDAILIIPAFMAGGRCTIEDVHYVAEGERLIPAAETPFARDAAFGYRASNLREWVAEKTRGRVSPEAVAALSLEDIRTGGPDRIYAQLMALSGGTYCIVNAVDERDLSVVALAVLRAEAAGKQFIARTAASFAALRAGIELRALLTPEALGLGSQCAGLVVVGSYVPKSSAQLEALLQTSIARVEVQVPRLLDATTRADEIERAAAAVDAGVSAGETVVVYTSRTLITGKDAAESLAIGKVVSESLVAIVRLLRARPGWIVAKGGITSSDMATAGLNVRRALVMGQILPGIPVWRLGGESRFPELVYVVFPGNVGHDAALVEVVAKLCS